MGEFASKERYFELFFTKNPSVYVNFMMAFLCKIPHATIGSSWGVSYPEHQVPSMCPQPFVHTQFSLRPSHLFNGLTLSKVTGLSF